MKKIQTLLIALVLTISSACQNKNNTMNTEPEEPKFKWEEMCNAPEGYPIEVYRGGIGGVGLANGLSAGNNGGWGAFGSGTSYGEKTLPHYIDCIWLSYAEDCFYKIDCPIDYDKLLGLFQEGYQDSNGKFGYRITTYDAIIVGFAPGGVVVIWAAGAGRQVEIGRYKGTKYEVPREEAAGLDASGNTIFDPKFRKMIMTSPNIVPIEMQNNPKPIPYGLWDSYRTRYKWRPIVEVQEGGRIHNIGFDMYNGEKEKLFDETLKSSKIENRAIPQGFGLGWKDVEGQGHGGNIDFDEQEITAAFKEMYRENPNIEAELYFNVNHANNFVTVMLKSGDKKIRLSKAKINVFKTRK